MSLESQGNLVTDKLFTGQRLDETGLYYYKAQSNGPANLNVRVVAYVPLTVTGLWSGRYYDPTIARFISADTLVPDLYNPQSLNRYSYAMNNPTKYKDPTGHFPWPLVLAGAVAGGVFGGIGYAALTPADERTPGGWAGAIGGGVVGGAVAGGIAGLAVIAGGGVGTTTIISALLSPASGGSGFVSGEVLDATVSKIWNDRYTPPGKYETISSLLPIVLPSFGNPSLKSEILNLLGELALSQFIQDRIASRDDSDASLPDTIILYETEYGYVTDSGLIADSGYLEGY